MKTALCVLTGKKFLFLLTNLTSKNKNCERFISFCLIGFHLFFYPDKSVGHDADIYVDDGNFEQGAPQTNR